MQVPESASTSRFEEEDDDDLPDIPWKKLTAALSDRTDLNDKNHVQTTADKAVAASPPTMNPKSYVTVTKPPVVAAAAPEPAVVPRLCASATVPSNGLNPSATACKKLAADTTPLKVSIRMCTCIHYLCFACALHTLSMYYVLYVLCHNVLCLYVHAAKMLEAYKYTACLSVRLRCIWSVRIRTTHAYRWLQTSN